MKGRQELVQSLVARRPGRFSCHSRDPRIRLGLCWDDVISLVANASWSKTERDPMKAARFIDSFVGRDTHGRNLYASGKELHDEEGEKYWYVITIHEAAAE